MEGIKNERVEVWKERLRVANIEYRGIETGKTVDRGLNFNGFET